MSIPTLRRNYQQQPDHQKLALKAAHEAIILLKNQNSLLPLDKSKYKRIAVIGPNAADLHLGGYSNKPGRGISLLQGFKDKVGSCSEVLYSEGCKITETLPDWDADKVVLGDPALNAKRIQDAVAVARKADIVILALGENEQTSREDWATNHLGDRDSLDLLGNQDDLVKAILATGKPTIVYLHARPSELHQLHCRECSRDSRWMVSRAGRRSRHRRRTLRRLQPRRKTADHRTALGWTITRLLLPEALRETRLRGCIREATFPFWLGPELYTRSNIGNLHVTPPTESAPRATTNVSVDVTNTGKIGGEEVVQLYIRDEVSSVTRPVKELRGFHRIVLDPGKTETVKFTLGPDELSFLNREMHRVVEPGSFKIMVGGNSADLIETKLNVIAR